MDEIVKDYRKGVSLASLSKGYGISIHEVINIVYSKLVR